MSMLSGGLIRLGSRYSGVGMLARFHSTYNKAAIDKIIKENKIVAFIKGTETEPMCGFSLSVIRVLQLHTNDGITYHNILADEELRQALKEYSKWPTFPQVYINGKFVGGCDIVVQAHKSGNLLNQLKEVGITSLLEGHYKKEE